MERDVALREWKSFQVRNLRRRDRTCVFAQAVARPVGRALVMKLARADRVSGAEDMELEPRSTVGIGGSGRRVEEDRGWSLIWVR